ncbi:unconventional myosin-XVIIIa-like isoform X1 [Arapaima gigas]
MPGARAAERRRRLQCDCRCPLQSRDVHSIVSLQKAGVSDLLVILGTRGVSRLEGTSPPFSHEQHCIDLTESVGTMFNRIKKDKEKDGGRKEKRDKKDKKERMSVAELKSLEEMSMRRGFFILHRGVKKESKNKVEVLGPTAVPSECGNSENSVTDPAGTGGAVVRRSSVRERATKSLAKQSSQVGQIMKRFSFSQKSREECPSVTLVSSPSTQVEVKKEAFEAPASAVDALAASASCPGGLTGDRPAARVPELVERRFPVDLQLPVVEAPAPPAARELLLRRRDTGDFGFSLRRTTMLDRGSTDGVPHRRVVHFAEPGVATGDLPLGLVPGDRLVEINGQNVETKTRDEIVEMIRRSGKSVSLKVQAIAELSELSRCWLRNQEGLRRDVLDVSTPPRSSPASSLWAK